MQDLNARQPMKYTAVSVTTGAQKVAITTGISGKEYMMVTNTGTKNCWIGDSTVTTSNGYRITPNGGYDFGPCNRRFNFYVVCIASSTTTLGVFEM